MKKVYITRKISDKAMEFLRERYEVVINPKEHVPDKAELIEYGKDCDAFLTMLSDAIDAEVIAQCPKVKVIANYAVGYNNIDLVAAKDRGIVITNTPDVLTAATADLAFSLIFAVARKIVESDRFVREEKFKMWSPTLMLGLDVTGKTLGIIGAGRIGKAIARRGAGFEMRLLYHNRKRDEVFEAETGAKLVSLDELLAQSDFISVNTPLTAETKHLIGDREFGLMKQTAILVNTARGPVIDEKALVKALEKKVIWGAGLDVYENEPLIETGLLKLDNAVLLPHIGSATIETRDEMAMMAARNIDAVLNGREPENRVTS